jgi:hypothetical protein
LKACVDSRVKIMKYLILIIAVLLLIAPSCGLFSPKSSDSSEVNETIVNYKAFSTKATMEPSEEAALEQRLADVL